MNNLLNRYIIVFISLTACFIIGTLFKNNSGFSSESAIAAINKIPSEYKNWHGRDVYLDPMVYTLLDTRAVLHREYKNSDGKSVFLSIVYYSDTKVDFHTPEGCLGGKGIYAKKSIKPISIVQDGISLTFDVAEIIADDNGRKSLVYYFYKAGNFIGQNYIKMRLHIAFNKFNNQNKSGALIRISTNYDSSVQESGKVVLKGFLDDFFTNINSNL